MEFYKKILSDKLFQGSQLSNFQFNTFLYQDNRPLPIGEMDVAINEYQQFTKERNESSCYRINGILRGLFTNVLFNVTGDRSYETILSLTGKTGEFNPNRQFFSNFGYGDILLETDGWFYIYTGSTPCVRPCEKVYLRPDPNDFLFLRLPFSGISNLTNNGDPAQNWFFKLTFPYSANCKDINFQSPYITGSSGKVTLCDGIVIENINVATLNGRQSTYIESAINHGLLDGDQIILRPFPNPNNEQIFNVLSVENETKFWIDYYDSNITVNLINYSITNISPLRFKRIFQGIESNYYQRRFSAITELNDYQLYNAGFSKNIYNDEIQLYHYNLDVNVKPYRDYLGRPISEIYLTKIKYNNTNSTVSFMVPWTLLSVGLLTNKPNQNYDVRAIYGGSPLRPLPPLPSPMYIETVDENTTDFFGDIMDYNVGSLTERVLVDAQYRFNTNNREDLEYGEGYYYRAHDKIQLLEFSSQVEIENLTLPDVDIPDYAVKVNGFYQWKDLLTPGFIDGADNGVDYPFLNGCTYIYTEHNLCLKRQNPSQDVIYSAGTNNINYWFEGINCDKQYGEFIEAVDGDC